MILNISSYFTRGSVKYKPIIVIAYNSCNINGRKPFFILFFHLFSFFVNFYRNVFSAIFQNVSHGNRENALLVFLRKKCLLNRERERERVRRLSVDIKMHDCKFSFISWRNTHEAGGMPNWKAQLQSSPGRRLGSPSVLIPVERNGRTHRRICITAK